MTARFAERARVYLGRACMYRETVCRRTARSNGRGRRFARKSDSGNQTCDVADAIALTKGFRLDIFSCTPES
jgi:hypothetical protein